MTTFPFGEDVAAVSQAKVFPGADEKTPSRSHYFTWINQTDEGPTEAQTLANLGFFRMLHDQYGMVLEIYAWDEGTIDGGLRYETLEMSYKRFPEGFRNCVEIAQKMGMRLGLWAGPDGFGETPEEEKARADMMISFCRDFNFFLFKFDAVCGPLRPEKQKAFRDMLIECRKYSPDLIALDHRLDLGIAAPYVTTTLWEGRETYIDVHMSNHITGTHNRVGAARAPMRPCEWMASRWARPPGRHRCLIPPGKRRAAKRITITLITFPFRRL